MDQPSSFAEAVATCASSLVLADLGDWQALLDLQAAFTAAQGLAPTTEQRECARAAVTLIEELFTRTLDEATLRSVRTDLDGIVQALAPEEESLPAPSGQLDEFLTRHLSFSEGLESTLSCLQSDPQAVATLRGRIHTLKGESGMLGLVDVGSVCHAIEEALADTAHLPAATIAYAIDWLQCRFQALAGNSTPEDSEPLDTLLARLHAGSKSASVIDDPFQLVDAAGPTASTLPTTKYTPDPTLAAGGPLPSEAVPEMVAEFMAEAQDHLQAVEGLLLAIEQQHSSDDLNAIFRSFHTIKGLAGFMHLRRERALAHASEDLLDALRNGNLHVTHAVADALFTSVDMMKALLAGLGVAVGGGEMPIMPALPGHVADLRRLAAGQPAADHGIVASGGTRRIKALGTILTDHGAATPAAVAAALHTQEEEGAQRRLGEILVTQGAASSDAVEAAVAAQEAARTVARAASGSAGTANKGIAVAATMRVDVDRVDALNDAIGELVIAQNMVSCCPELRSLGSRRVQSLLGQLDRVTRSIQHMAMRLRLVSIQPVFQRMVRLGRDAAKKLDKEVEVVLDGEDQELDKSVVDGLGDPLVHLVRNAVDHGLELPEARIAAGKPRVGRVTLRAFRRSGSFCVEVSDDGKGLDRARILAKAVERGLVREGTSLSDAEIFDLIFLPGFSTAEKITEVSGRGVGMDVVRRMVEDMRGSVTLTSVAGQGTTITILLPLTLAIIDGMIVSVAGLPYILPTLSVVTSVRARPEDVTSVHGRCRMLTFHGHQIPLFSLRSAFGHEGAPPRRPLVVVVEDGLRQVGLEVDAVLGRQQVVLKAMSEGLPPAPGIGGATINGDGKVCLVCDIASLVQLASSNALTQPVPAGMP